MASCPFCKSSISEELARFGGPCPTCFNEVPGEEAATDPGVEAQHAEAEAQKQESMKKRSTSLVLIALLVVAGAVATSSLALKKSREANRIAEVLEAETSDFFVFDDEEIIVTSAPTEDGGTEAVASAGTSGSKSGGTSGGGTRPPEEASSGRGSGGDRLAGGGAAPSSGGSDVAQSTMGVPGSIDIKGPSTLITRDGAVITDDKQKADMARQVMSRNAGQLKACYESALKSNDSLRGVWTVQFTVNTDGSVSNAKAVGKNGADAGLEACLVRNVSNWRFSKINKPFPVAKNYRFGSSY